jgi:glutathione S-transferase
MARLRYRKPAGRLKIMKLVYTTRSPFARKCLAAAIELGLDDRIEQTKAEVGIGVKNEPYTSSVNPLGKLPSLVLDDGTSLVDSGVIVEYLDDLAGGGKLIPRGKDRWRVLSEHAIVQGMTDSIVAARRERAVRPKELHWQTWDEDQIARVRQALAWFEARPNSLAGDFNVAQLSLVCALDYMSFRMPEEAWKGDYPKVAAFMARVSGRPSLSKTAPKM